MPTIVDMMNLMIQCTNAIIATVSAVGMLIFTLGVVYMGQTLAQHLHLALDNNHWHRPGHKVYYWSVCALALAGTVAAVLVVT